MKSFNLLIILSLHFLNDCLAFHYFPKLIKKTLLSPVLSSNIDDIDSEQRTSEESFKVIDYFIAKDTTTDNITKINTIFIRHQSLK